MAFRDEFPPTFNSKNTLELGLLSGVPGYSGEDPSSTMATHGTVQYDITLCDVANDKKQYMGLYGDDSGCALYDVKPEWWSSDDPSATCVQGVERL